MQLIDEAPEVEVVWGKTTLTGVDEWSSMRFHTFLFVESNGEQLIFRETRDYSSDDMEAVVFGPFTNLVDAAVGVNLY